MHGLVRLHSVVATTFVFAVSLGNGHRLRKARKVGENCATSAAGMAVVRFTALDKEQANACRNVKSVRLWPYVATRG
jgi:hypothetical protein